MAFAAIGGRAAGGVRAGACVGRGVCGDDRLGVGVLCGGDCDFRGAGVLGVSAPGGGGGGAVLVASDGVGDRLGGGTDCECLSCDAVLRACVSYALVLPFRLLSM